MISTGFVFIFSKLWFFGSLGGGIKRQKITTQNDKKFCLSRSVSQEPYIIWLSFMVHLCKMISPGVLFFKIMIFWVARKGRGAEGGGGKKKSPKWQPCIIWS